MTTASSLERTGDLSLYGTISMALLIGLLTGLIILALIDRGDDTTPAITSLLAEARADQLRRHAVLGTPTDEHPIVPTAPVTRMDVPPRGQGVSFDRHTAGRHRRLAGALSATTGQRPSFAKMGLDEAMAWLAVDRVKREAERVQFNQMMMGVFT